MNLFSPEVQKQSRVVAVTTSSAKFRFSLMQLEAALVLLKVS